MMMSQRLPVRPLARRALAFSLAIGGAACLAQSPSSPSHSATAAQPARSGRAVTAGEAHATREFEGARQAGAAELYAFLKSMPKGADLHMHLSGAVYAETIIADAAQQGLCVTPVDPGMPAVPEGQDAVRVVAPQHNTPNDCGAGQVPATDALKNQPLYDDMIDSFSMRAFVPSEGIDGHDQFFATFDRFSAVKADSGEWLDKVITRAATQNEQYLEIMQTPVFSHSVELGSKFGWPAGAENAISREQLARLREQLLASGLRDEIPVDEAEFAAADAARNSIEHCSRLLGAKAGDLTPCSVHIHWIYQVLRGFPPQQVFAQTLLGFEVASADPDVVGLNFVMPEDGYLSMRDYHLQMQMVDYLHSIYPKVHITLHAGELAFGMVPPEGLSFHIRQAVELGHAERIGHGVDVLYEANPQQLLHEMADKHVMVEVNLTSNAVILGISGKQHPLHAYMAAHVPWALSTDDEGVARSDLTHEYVAGALTQDLTYADLKRSARNSLEYSFAPGESLWSASGDFSRTNGGCPDVVTEHTRLPDSCAGFLNTNEKAALQFDLERRFAVFEAAAH
jgi:adenosine deaminase